MTKPRAYTVDLGSLHGSIDQMAAYQQLPESLTLADRCDRCGAQALHAFAFKLGDLLLCTHHARKIHNQGAEYLAHRDYRQDWAKFQGVQRMNRNNAIIANINEQKAPRAAINDRVVSASKDDAGTSISTHLARWDRAAGYWKAHA